MNGQCRVEIAAVTVCNSGTRDIFGVHLDSPRVEVVENVFSLNIAGWCIARRRCAEGIEVVCEDAVLAKCEMLPRPDVAAAIRGAEFALDSGFSIFVSVLDLPTTGVLQVNAKLSNGVRIPIFMIEFDVRIELLNSPSRLRPLFVHSVGRSGTTLTMQILRAHPQVSVHNEYPHEVRHAQYNLHAMRILSRYIQMDRAEMLTEQILIDKVGPNFTFGAYGSMANFYHASYAPAEITHRLDQIDSFYKAYSTGEAIYFAEKWGADANIMKLCQKIDTTRNIIILRDPRDTMCSMLSFNRKKGYQSFGANIAPNFADHARLILSNLEVIQAIYIRDRQRSLLLRYEDLILQPRSTIEGIYAFLGLESDDAVVDKALALFKAPIEHGHATSIDPMSSISRWMHDLGDEEKSLCAGIFRDFIERFYGGSEMPLASAL